MHIYAIGHRDLVHSVKSINSLRCTPAESHRRTNLGHALSKASFPFPVKKCCKGKCENPLKRQMTCGLIYSLLNKTEPLTNSGLFSICRPQLLEILSHLSLDEFLMPRKTLASTRFFIVGILYGIHLPTLSCEWCLSLEKTGMILPPRILKNIIIHMTVLEVVQIHLIVILRMKGWKSVVCLRSPSKFVADQDRTKDILDYCAVPWPLRYHNTR